MKPEHSSPKTRLSFSHGVENLLFVPALGAMLLVGTVIACWNMGIIPPLAVLPVLLGITLLAMRSGVQIDAQNRKVRNYLSIWGMRLGRWKNLNRYQDILMLQQIRSNGHGFLAAGNQTGTRDTKGISEIYLTNHNHLDRFLVKVYYRTKKADTAVRALADATGFEYVRYNPGKRRARTVHYAQELHA